MAKHHKYQRSKRARAEEKLARTLLFLGLKVDTLHSTSHISGGRGRPKDRWHCDEDKHNAMMNNIIRRA